VKDLAIIDFNGIQIAFEGDKINLTHLWKSTGSKHSQRVQKWLLQDESQKFVGAVAEDLKALPEGVLRAKPGRNGGTWAHWQIALAYAKYLSPKLHMRVNQVFKERVEEENNPELGINRSLERAERKWGREGKSEFWQGQRVNSIMSQKRLMSVVGQRGDDSFVYAIVNTEINKALLGETAREFKRNNKIPVKKATREFLDADKLTALDFTQMLVVKNLVAADAKGNSDIKKITADTAKNVANLLK